MNSIVRFQILLAAGFLGACGEPSNSALISGSRVERDGGVPEGSPVPSTDSGIVSDAGAGDGPTGTLPAPGSDGGTTTQPDASSIASIAWSQIGCDGCGGTGSNGQTCAPAYGNSCNEDWCSDFATWVWAEAGYNTDGLTPCSGSFYDYGVANHTLHLDTPKVGDAVVWNYGNSCGADHIELVVDVSNAANGTITGLSGNGCNAVVCEDYPCSKAGECDSYTSGWILSGFISPVAAGAPPPPSDPCSGLGDGEYCGNDPSYNDGNSASNTLYQCSGGVTSGTQSCTNGCTIASGTQDDFCN